MVVDRGGDDDLICPRLLDEPVEPVAHGVRRADERPLEHAHDVRALVGPPPAFDVVDRRRQLSALPRSMFANVCCMRGEQPARLVVGVGGDHVDAATMAYGRSSCARRLEALAVDRRAPAAARPARSARRTRTAARARPRAAAPNRLEPRIQSGTFEAGAGNGAHALSRPRVTEQRLQLDARPAGRCRRAGRSRRSARAVALVGARRAPEAEVDAARDRAPRACRTARR